MVHIPFCQCFLNMVIKRYLFQIVTLFFAIGCESAEDKIARQATEAAQSSSGIHLIPDGAAVFRKNCVTCHGAKGSLGLNGAKDLTASNLNLDERMTIITEGKKLMTPFGVILSRQEIKAVAEYTLTLKN